MHSTAGFLDHTEELAEKMLREASRLPRLIESLARANQQIVSRMNDLKRAGFIDVKPLGFSFTENKEKCKIDG